ncbi:UvrD-helicase domain-containing protein [Actinoallomurus iriomotensis]|uniref:DNA 3'-5' helicase n=1 Tax=Actinoallomurus iriomotensis TaxID=478107 RepID=A0A9W6RTI3_9ACTN|nr:UvrD-helicase domain-containing protein [Actinoallomurus iriomotensis]GLY82286.1 DNA helicase [Actinoallomurus iriomotensis]
MPQLAFATSFFDEYDRLEKHVRQGVRTAMEKFQQLTAAELHADKGLHLEQVEKSRDPRIRTIRITGSWRGVVLAPDDGSGTFLLLKVLQHDDAYAWAVKRVFTVNAVTCGLEVRNIAAIEELTPVLQQAAKSASSLLFEKYSDTVLRDLGIDGGVLPAVRTIVDKPQLEAFSKLLPEDQYEVLFYLAEGHGPDEIWRDVVVARRPSEKSVNGPADLATAIANTRDRIALVSGPKELEDILTRPFSAWRIFLHPTQRRVAYRPSYSGPAQVSGGPGTGKTVVALHRVKHLLQKSDDTRILLTTFTNALADSLRENLNLLLDDPLLLERVDVTTVNAVARQIVDEHGTVPALVSDDDADTRRRWQRIARRLDLPWTEQFLALEFRHVILGQGIGSIEKYLTASRAGRGASLQAPQREHVWRAVEEFVRQLDAEGKRTYLQLCADAAELLKTAGPRYDHVVVDEAQDLHPAQWRVLRGLVVEGPDDLFVAGDPHQRIYDTRVSLRSLGISVIGRSTRLRINYRSTQEILTWSSAIMTGERVDDLDGGSDSLTGYRSALHGGRPTVRPAGTQPAEIDAVVAKIQSWMEDGVEPSEIAVATRFHQFGSRAKVRLEDEGIPVVALKDGPDASEKGVRIATMHAMKGLEFRCVAAIGVNDRAFPLDAAVTPAEVDRVQHEVDMLAERSLLFVACTRARDDLYVSWHGTPSSFIPGA